MVSSQLRSHMCVQTQYDACSIQRAVSRLTNRQGCDANAMGMVYTLYMCTAIILRLCTMVQSVDTKLYLKVEGGAFPVW